MLRDHTNNARLYLCYVIVLMLCYCIDMAQSYWCCTIILILHNRI